MDATNKFNGPNIQPANLNGSKTNNLKLFAMGLVTIAVVLFISLASKDSSSIMKNTYLYALPILLVISMIFVYFINLFDSKTKAYAYSFIMFAIAIIIAITVSIAVIHHTGIYGFFTNNYLINGLLLCIVLIALAIFYYVFLEKYATRSGWIPFIIKFLFYIPCIIGDGIQYLIKDFYSTENYIFNLMFIEVLLLAGYFYLYPRIQKSVYENGVALLKHPVLLNDQKRIESELYKSLAVQSPNPVSNQITKDSPVRETFSLSMWIYLNVQPFTQLSYLNESTIFAYVDPSGNGHPKITYKNNTQGVDEYVFYLSPSTKYVASLPHQKWNNIVFNYRNGYVDLFINGILESSIKLEDQPSFSKRDIMYVGEKTIERSGLYGSICNIVYYKNILTKGQIIDNYNLLSIQNPPLNSLVL
jgi:hypothetical protein